MAFFRKFFGPSIVVGAGCFGVLPATMLPATVGAVRDLAGVVGFAAGAGIAAWLLLPFSDRPPFLETVRELRTLLLIAAVPTLLYWGPIVGGTSLAQGISDQRLVSLLRQHGAAVTGSVVDIPTTGTAVNDDGTPSTYSTDHYFLQFTAGAYGTVRTPDPAIAGHIWPVNDMGTATVTVVYDPANPHTAAVAGQIQNSPWAGAPTANVISGAALTALLGAVLWLLIREARAALRRSRRQEQWPRRTPGRVPAR